MKNISGVYALQLAT